MLMGAAMFQTASAKTVTISSLDKINNQSVYVLYRLGAAANGGGYVHTPDGAKTLMAASSGKGVTVDSISAQWSIHYSSSEQTYFLYNLKTGTFANFNNKNQAILSTAPADTRIFYHSNARAWTIDCAGALLGLDSDSKGTALFSDDIDRDAAREKLCYFTIYQLDHLSVNTATNNLIEQKIKEGRADVLKTYTDFLTKAKTMVSSTNKNNAAFLGLYDTEELEYAMEHSDEYTMSQLEEIYQKTLLSRYPKAGKFYRLHNAERPSSYYRNTLRTREDGELWGEQFTDYSYGTATDGYSDDLCLFRFWPVNDDPTQVKIQVAAFGNFLTKVNNNTKPGRTLNPAEAEVYTVDTKSVTARTFIFGQSSGDLWLTVGGSYDLVTWNKKENSMYFYLEPVDSIEVKVDTNGYASVCLPCGVKVPEGCKAYTATSVMNGKIFIEEIEGYIHQYTPWILKANAGTTSVKVPVENNLAYTPSELTGNVRVNSSTPGRYVPEYSASGISFNYVAATEPAEKSLPGSIYYVSDDQGPLTTVMGANPEASIEEITVDDASARELFDLQGRKVIDTPRAGLYINAATKRVVRVK